MSTARLTTIGLALVAGLVGCRDTTAPAEPLTEVLESEHYIYRFSAGDAVNTEWQETYHEWLLTEIEVTLPRKLEYFKYRDRDHLRRLTGEDTNGFAEPGAYRFHSIWPADNHESVHAVTSGLFGLAPMLINEGFAVAHQTIPWQGIYEPHWGPTPIHDLAADYLDAGSIPPLDELLESRGFGSFDPETTYPIAGSFVRHLIDTAGLEPVKQLMGASTFEDSAARLRSNFQSAFGQSIDDAWAGWQAFLRARG